MPKHLLTILPLAASGLTAVGCGPAPAETQDAIAEETPTEVTYLLPEASTQYLLVLTEGWDSRSATAYLVDAAALPPQVIARSPAVVGKNGLAWGVGMHPMPASGRRKAEGDGRAPAGMFTFGACMGYAEAPPYQHDWPYEHLTEHHLGIDDPASLLYNQVVDTMTVADKQLLRFSSFERMRRSDDLYRELLLIGHNTDNTPGAGSLIFLHHWRSAEQGTAGCTAVPADFMRDILSWLRRDKQPVLVQLPRPEYERLWIDWGLIDPASL